MITEVEVKEALKKVRKEVIGAQFELSQSIIDADYQQALDITRTIQDSLAVIITLNGLLEWK